MFRASILFGREAITAANSQEPHPAENDFLPRDLEASITAFVGKTTISDIRRA